MIYVLTGAWLNPQWTASSNRTECYPTAPWPEAPGYGDLTLATFSSFLTVSLMASCLACSFFLGWGLGWGSVCHRSLPCPSFSTAAIDILIKVVSLPITVSRVTDGGCPQGFWQQHRPPTQPSVAAVGPQTQSKLSLDHF